jgi:hypothetical protein
LAKQLSSWALPQAKREIAPLALNTYGQKGKKCFVVPDGTVFVLAINRSAKALYLFSAKGAV